MTDEPTAEEDSSDEGPPGPDGAEVASATSSDEGPPGPDGAEYGAPVTWSRGQKVIHPARENWYDTATALLADGWNMCVDVTAVDYSGYGPARDLPAGVAAERYEVVCSFLSHTRRERIRARIQIPADDPTIASLYPLYPGTDYLEREVYDLMGIVFDGHPDLSRILMPETWDGHPLRKDYAVGAIPVQFKAPAN